MVFVYAHQLCGQINVCFSMRKIPNSLMIAHTQLDCHYHRHIMCLRLTAETGDIFFRMKGVVSFCFMYTQLQFINQFTKQTGVTFKAIPLLRILLYIIVWTLCIFILWTMSIVMSLISSLTHSPPFAHLNIIVITSFPY